MNLSSEELGRFYFSRAIEEWGKSDYDSARMYIEKTFENPLYPGDLGKIWFFLAKLDIETGNSREAIESLNNVLLVQPNSTEILILLKSLKEISNIEKAENEIIGLDYFKEINGYLNSYEFFYNPVSTEIYRDAFYILDRANKFIYVNRNNENIILPLEIESPSSLVIDKVAGIAYISDISSGNVYSVDLETGEIINTFTGFIKPFVKSVDRLGNLYVLDPPNNLLKIMSSRGLTIKHIYLSSGYIPHIVNDVDVSGDMLILQDMSLKAFRMIRIPSYEEEDLIDFRENLLPVCGCIDGDGNLINLWNDGTLTYYPLRGENREFFLIDTTNILLSGISDMDYAPPLLSFTDFDDHVIKNYVLMKKNPDGITIIDGLEVNEDILSIYFRTLLTSGEMLQIITPFLNVIDSGGYVPFVEENVMHPSNLIVVEDGKKYFEEEFKNLKKNNFNTIIWKYDGYDIIYEDLATAMLEKNARVFVVSNLSVPYKVQKLARITGGMVITSDMYTYLQSYYSDIKHIWTPKLHYRLSLPFEGIKSVTVSTRIAGMDYSDSIYYVKYMIPSVKEDIGLTEESTATNTTESATVINVLN